MAMDIHTGDNVKKSDHQPSKKPEGTTPEEAQSEPSVSTIDDRETNNETNNEGSKEHKEEEEEKAQDNNNRVELTMERLRYTPPDKNQNPDRQLEL